MPRPRRLIAPSRLHFGLYSFGNNDRRQYGGIGVMVDQPRAVLHGGPAERFAASGPRADRIIQFAHTWALANGYDELPPVALSDQESPGEHAGLGSGTQLGMSVGAMLHALTGTPQPPASDLARSVGRGLRSAVGAHGFALGGLIAESGKDAEHAVSPLYVRVEVPSAWRFVLLQPKITAGISGTAEAQAFTKAPPVDPQRTDELVAICQSQLLPAAALGDFDAFAKSLYRYSVLAGDCFSSIQGGPYNGPILTQWIDRMRAAGAVGVGQSSWGPTLFAAVPNHQEAAALLGKLQGDLRAEGCDARITAVSQSGARFELDAALPDAASEKMIAVAVVEQAGKFLVGTRQAGTDLPGKSEFPGGKVEPNELPAAAAERECWEETGLSVRAGQLLLEKRHQYPHATVRLHFYRCRPIEGEIRPPWRWLDRGDLKATDFPEANGELIERLVRAVT
jgi:beta-ribofuranosylaminobenzene 5'-phosphate synthase